MISRCHGSCTHFTCGNRKSHFPGESEGVNFHQGPRTQQSPSFSSVWITHHEITIQITVDVSHSSPGIDTGNIRYRFRRGTIGGDTRIRSTFDVKIIPRIYWTNPKGQGMYSENLHSKDLHWKKIYN